ncbi:MAG: flagellar motor protein MotB [Desulfopila sp.]|jgi:chemotaxis protein MotB|nr:flagellar motor protein MotB [Desulfopila sp.]
MTEEQKPTEERKKKKTPTTISGAPMWMVTYSDLVTLLLTFFVLLLSMASLDPVRFTEASSSLKDAFGLHTRPSNVEFAIPVIPSPPITEFAPIQNDMTTKIYREIKTLIDKENLSQDIDVVEQDGNTLILRVKDTILFDTGETKIAPKSYSLLRFIADTIRPMPLLLRIEGHADPASETQIELEQWDISMARSVSVLRFLTKGDLLPLDRMSAAGYGGSKPVSASNTEEGRALNRRVDFVLRTNTMADVNHSKTQKADIPF